MKNSSNSSIENDGRAALGAYLSPLAVIALSFGYAVGWGAFVLPGTVFLPKAGPVGTLIGILIGMAAMLVFALNYHRLVIRRPGPGGAYGFVAKAFGTAWRDASWATRSSSASTTAWPALTCTSAKSC